MLRQEAWDLLRFGLVELDESDVVVDANEVFADWAGFPVAEIVRRPISDFLSSSLTSTEERADLLPSYRILLTGEGIGRTVRVESSPGLERHRILAVLDGSVQQNYADQLLGRNALTKRTQRRLELVIAASIAFANTDTESELAQVLVDTAVRAFGAEEAVVFLREGGDFRLAAGSNPLAGLDDTEALAVQGRSLRNAFTINGVTQANAIAPAIGRAFEHSGVRALIVAPIRQRDESIGVLGVFFRHARTFDEQASPLAEALAGQAGRAITNLRLRGQLQHAATHDEITGLPNRRLLEEHLARQSNRDEGIFAVFFVDLDGFKTVNDRFGHDAGDELLREVAARLQSTVRDGDLVARFGGDEFVIVCRTLDEASALEIAARLLDAVREPHSFLGEELRLGASIGLAVSDRPLVSADAHPLLRSADQAMYRAKLAGGNRTVVGILDAVG